MFSVRVITTSGAELDKGQDFCRSNLWALLIAGFMAPIFGITNDLLGIRVNNTIGMFAMCMLSLLVTWYELYGSIG